MNRDVRGWLGAAWLAAAGCLAGCEEEDIRVYEVPKDVQSTPVARQPAPRGAAGPGDAPENTPARDGLELPEGHPPLSDAAEGAPGDAGGGMTPGMPAVDGGRMVDDGTLPAAKEQTDTRLTYTVPDGWREGPGSRMRVATLFHGQGEQQWEMSIIPLGGGAGGMLANINRWAGQVGAERWAPDDLDDRAEPVPVGGEPGTYVQLRGPNEAIVGAIVPHDGMNWFFKARGPVANMDAVIAGFKTFLQSVQWREADDASGKDDPSTDSTTQSPDPAPAGSTDPTQP